MEYQEAILPFSTKEETSHQPAVRNANARIAGSIAAAFTLGAAGAVAFTSRSHSPAVPVQAAPADQAPEKSGDAQIIKFDTAAIKAADIKIETVRISTSTTNISVPGTVTTSPNRTAKITPPVAGKVVRIYASLGDSVRAGQPLAALDSIDIAQAHAAVRQAQSAVLQANAALNTARAQTREAHARQTAAEATLLRQRQLAQAGAFSQGPLAAAQSEVSQAQADLAQSQSELQTLTSAAERAERLFNQGVVSRVDMEQAQAAMTQSRARADQASTRVSLSKQALNREQTIHAGSLLDKQAIQTAEAEVRSSVAAAGTAVSQTKAAAATLQAAKIAVATAQANLSALGGGQSGEGGSGLIILKAPMSGVITERQATIGEAVERSTSLFQIENLNSVMVNANVPEDQIGKVRVGQRASVKVSAYPDQRFSGVIDSLGSRVDEKTRALPVRLLVENRNGHLRPEMFASASLGVGDATSGIVVPSSAIDDDGPDRFVYVEKSGGFEKRAVQLGATTHDNAVVTSGLKAGERIVVDGAFILKSESKKDELKGDDD